MKAAQLTAPGTVEVTEIPPPSGDLGVVVEAETMGICGTDVKVVEGKIPVSIPRTLGHELVGRVVSSSDPAFPVGARVLADPGLACGTCHQCLHRRPHLCRRGGLMGREVDGVFARYTAVDAGRLLTVPETVSDRAAGLLQVLGTCVHGLRTVDVFPGDAALVMGLGVAGQLMVQLLAQRGATVIGVTRSEDKRRLAARNGAAAVAPPDEAAALVDEMTDGEGPELVVEAVGTERTLARSIELAGTAADVVVFGTITQGEGGLPYYQLYFKELTLWNPRAALLEDYARAIQLVAEQRLEVEEIVTHVVSFHDIHTAFDHVADPASLKVLLTNPEAG